MLALGLYCFAFYLAAGLAVPLGYHRCLTHRSFRLRKWFEYLVIFAGLPAGGPVQWVGNHRAHHVHVDTEQDPHSPIAKGFWYAHCGWYINSTHPIVCLLYALAGPIRFMIDAVHRPMSNQQYNGLAKDVAEDKFYGWLSTGTGFRSGMLFHILVPFGIAFFLWGWAGVALLWCTLSLIQNLGDGVNSFGHGDDSHDYKNNKAKNSWLWSLITFGDAFHADHHEHPATARLGIQSRIPDLGWYVISLLKMIHLAYDVKVLEGQKIKQY